MLARYEPPGTKLGGEAERAEQRGKKFMDNDKSGVSSDVHSFNVFKPVETREVAIELFRNSLATLGAVSVLDGAFSTWVDWSSADTSSDFMMMVLMAALTLIVVFWVRQRGTPWGGAVILVLGGLGILTKLLDSETFSHGIGATRGTLLLYFVEAACLVWLARALLYTAKHGGNLRLSQSEAPLSN